ncbi:MAG: hypothetical protein IJK81_11225 [Selenomonadaceae bacterium]|nr:hypothetical protein [Selenomonadaceae bacterium]
MGKLTDEQKANLSQEVIAKAMQCETPEQLIELAKSEGIELTLDEAEAYLSEMDDFELDSQQLKGVAGGWDCNNCDDYCGLES